MRTNPSPSMLPIPFLCIPIYWHVRCMCSIVFLELSSCLRGAGMVGELAWSSFSCFGVLWEPVLQARVRPQVSLPCCESVLFPATISNIGAGCLLCDMAVPRKLYVFFGRAGGLWCLPPAGWGTVWLPRRLCLLRCALLVWPITVPVVTGGPVVLVAEEAVSPQVLLFGLQCSWVSTCSCGAVVQQGVCGACSRPSRGHVLVA